MTTDHRWARGVITRAFRSVIGREPTLAELQAVHATGALESGYGRWWCPASGAYACPGPGCRCVEIEKGRTSNNWGAVQCSNKPPCGPTCFEHQDSIPQADGSSKWYRWCYKRYPTPEEGAADVIRFMQRMGVLDVARSTASSFRVAERMYDQKYYGGFGATRLERILGRMKASDDWIAKVARQLEEPVALRPGYPPPAAGFDTTTLAVLALGIAAGAGVAWAYKELRAA